MGIAIGLGIPITEGPLGGGSPSEFDFITDESNNSITDESDNNLITE